MRRSIALTVNGSRIERDVEPRTLLVHFLREELGLTGTHIGCDTSSCGACTVHVDGEAVKSCTVLAVQADGSAVTTIEGLSDDGLHPIQQAFHEQHALQCGYCTPGMIMSATQPARAQPEPDGGRDPRRTRGQPLPLHRLPEHRGGREARGRPPLGGRLTMATVEATPAGSGIGASPLRKEDAPLIAGQGRYVDDLKLPGMLHAAFVRSPHALGHHPVDRHVRRRGAARRRPGADRRDARPRGRRPVRLESRSATPKHVKRPMLAEGRVRMLGEPVALVIASDRSTARDAADRVVVDYDPTARRDSRRGRARARCPAAARRRAGKPLLHARAQDRGLRRRLRCRAGQDPPDDRQPAADAGRDRDPRACSPTGAPRLTS